MPNLVDARVLHTRISESSTKLTTATRAVKLRTLQVPALWNDPAKTQVIALEWWQVMIFWTMASSVLYGSVPLGKDGDCLHVDVYRLCVALCDQAESRTELAIRHENILDQATYLPRSQPLQLPELVVTVDTYTAIWQMITAVFLQVDNDLQSFRKGGIPKRFGTVVQQLEAAVGAPIRKLDELQAQWYLNPPPNEKLTIVRDAVPAIRDLFIAVQRWFAPYTMGKDYEYHLQRKLGLDELDVGFDPWFITDPRARALLTIDESASDALAAFWASNPAPARAAKLHQEILAARAQGLVRNSDEYMHYCPWVTIWVAWRPVTIGGVALEPGDKFVLYCDTDADDQFVNEIRAAGTLRVELRPL